MRGVEPVCEMANRFESSRRDRSSCEWFHLHEIFVRADLQLFRCSPFLNFPARRFRLIEPMQAGDYAIDFRFSHQALREQFTQEPAARQFFHLYAVLGNLAVGFE